jgi:hypothetical protein
MRKKAIPSRPALAALGERERLLGITFPASLREFYALKGAAAILEQHSNEDPAVPVEELGDQEAVAHGFLRIQDENQGAVAWYVRLDGSDDPPVEVKIEYIRDEPAEGGEDDGWWADAEFNRVADCFSRYVYQRVLNYGGSREDRRAVSKLKPYAAYVQCNRSGRAVRCTFCLYMSGKKASQPPRPVDAAAMELVWKFAKLEELDIQPLNVDASAWAILRDHPTIACLRVGSLDDGAAEHVSAMPALRELDVNDRRLTHVGLARLLRMPQLNAFSIRMREPTTARGLAALEGTLGLERLELDDWESTLSNDALAHLARLSSLKELRITSTNITDEGLKHLAGLSQLVRLFLNRLSITDAGLAHLARFTSLTFLRVWNNDKIQGDGLRHLTGLRALRSLDVFGLPIVDEALVHLAELIELTDLNLRETQIVGPGLRHLSRLTNLRELSLRWCAVVDEGMTHLAALTSLEDLDISGAKITDAGLRALAPLKMLRMLRVLDVPVSSAAIQDIEAAIPGLKCHHF